MTKIDRYILRNFFKTLALWYVCLVGLYVVFDLFTNMESIISSGVENGNVVIAIGRYYFFKSFQFFDILVSLLIMISAMITLSTMIRHNEMIPLLAAGISQLRIIMPIIGAAALVTFLAMACRELLLPQYLDDLLAKNPSEIGQKNGTPVKGITDHQTDVQLNGGKAFWNNETIENPKFIMPAGLNIYGRSIEAKSAKHMTASETHPAGYMLKDVTSPLELLTNDSLKLNGQAVVVTPKDAPDWISSTDCFVASQITFHQIAGGEIWEQYGSTLELVKGARGTSLQLGESVYSVIHSRITQPLLDITLLLLGLPIILAKSDRNVFKALGIGALLIVAFLAVQMICKSVGISYHQPILGAWFPLIMFVPLAAYSFYDLLR
ncbi:MAG: LptF/LptG family permease [Planctomycetaceae bacterium]|jgi:lipopolysaccharide export system permease protein|nr:LptF/LptG family permease [Planctomycetaceae bacterium]